MNEKITEPKPNPSLTSDELKKSLQCFDDAPDNWEALCRADDDVDADVEGDGRFVEDTDPGQSIGGDTPEGSSLSPELVTLKAPLQTSSHSPHKVSPLVKKSTVAHGINLDSVWDMYDEQKVDGDSLPTSRILDTPQAEDVPEDWEALAEDDDLGKSEERSKGKPIEKLEEADAPTESKTTTCCKKETLASSPQTKVKSGKSKPKRRRRKKSASNGQDSHPSVRVTQKTKQVEQYDSVWDMVQPEEEPNRGERTDDSSSISLVHPKCFLLQSPAPTEDWEAFYSETSPVF